MPIPWNLRGLAAATVAVALAGGAALTVRRGEAAPARAPDDMAGAPLRDADIRFYERRAAADPWGAADRARLAALHLQRGRERASLADFRRAEELARAALRLREGRNDGARLALASSLLAQHRFAEARREAEVLVEQDPARAAHLALLAEIQMELGDYPAAAASFGALEAERGNLAVAPRLARWYELQGRTAAARALLRQAADETSRRPDLPREQAAWFHLRIADLETRNGELDRAGASIRAGLRAEPADHRLRAAMARVMFLRGRWREAIAWGESAGERADLATLALVGDAHAALGERAAAERWYARLEAQAAANPEPFNRQITQFRVDHGRTLAASVALLRREAAERPDVLGLDLYAWALYRGGDLAGADAVMRRALRMGTRDAVLRYHAGLIAKAAGRPTEAAAQLRLALAINPRFHPDGVREARAALDDL